jgi:hypothetical protein
MAAIRHAICKPPCLATRVWIGQKVENILNLDLLAAPLCFCFPLVSNHGRGDDRF